MKLLPSTAGTHRDRYPGQGGEISVRAVILLFRGVERKADMRV